MKRVTQVANHEGNMPPRAKKSTQNKTTVSTVSTPTSDVTQPRHEQSEVREVKFPKLKITECSTTADPEEGGRGPLTPEEWKHLLGWETETQYQVRKMQDDPGSSAEKWELREEYHCKNTKGEKVRCGKNPNNRPFDMVWCEHLIQTVLTGTWAGPHTIPGETVNGETVRIGKYESVLSGQHQGTAVILADEKLQLDRAREDYTPENAKYPFWNGHDHPFIETILITGLSEDERVLRTIDYVKPRTAADMLYTMPLFRDNTSQQRREMTRMLSAAIDVLWKRTKALGYKTHPEVVGFLERHRRLLEFVEHLFTENSVEAAEGGRKISKLKLSPGTCAALGYLMACSGSDDDDYGERYRNGDPPSEKFLDFSMWDKATEFWTRMAGGMSFIPVRYMLQNVLPMTSPYNYPDPMNLGNGGQEDEKLAVISKAWQVWKEHPGLHGDDKGIPVFDQVRNPDGSISFPDLQVGGRLYLSYTNLSKERIVNLPPGADGEKKKKSIGGKPMPDGKIRLIDLADFSGIDYFDETGDPDPDIDGQPEAPAPSPEEIETLALAERKRTEEEERRKKEEEGTRRREEHRRKLLENREKRLKGGTEG